MRTIKFRGQDIASNKWLYGDLRHHKTDVCIFEQEGNRGEQVKPETVGQFTGLKDRNGREIYEGDILRSDNYPFHDEGEDNYMGVVFCDTNDAIGEFEVMQFVLNKTTRRGISNFISVGFIDIDLTKVEVYGNIFDNKGLFRNSDEDVMKWFLED